MGNTQELVLDEALDYEEQSELNFILTPLWMAGLHLSPGYLGPGGSGWQ